MKKIFSEYNFPEGEILLIDKPLEWTSFDVVNKIRGRISRKLKIKKIKVGHAGTLDPLATGLLIVCTGKFTKKINELQLLEKEYTGTFHLGATTPSFDKETEIDQKFVIDNIKESDIKNAVETFKGEIEQVPPIYSAIKIEGKRAYQMARDNDDVKLKSRIIHISEYDLLGINLPEIEFRISCSKGTYIRSLARDLGKSLNNGAYLTSLRRTRIGHLNIEDAMTISEFDEMLNNSVIK